MIYNISSCIANARYGNWLCYIGRNSMDLFAIHYFDYAWAFLWNRLDDCYFLPVRLCADLIVFIVLQKVKGRIMDIRRRENEGKNN